MPERVTIGASAATVTLAGLSPNEWAAIVGAVVAVASLGVSVYYNQKKYNLLKKRTESADVE